jgi:RNA polymerase subunit RPABC4/transcription elongation factor Spt4
LQEKNTLNIAIGEYYKVLVIIHQLNTETAKKLEDLALVCPNCHGMLHKDENLSVEGLKKNRISIAPLPPIIYQ